MKRKEKSVFSYIVIGVLLVLTLLLFFLSGQTARYDLEIGDISPDDIYAPRSVVDRVYTEKLRDAAASKVGEQYAIDTAVEQNSKLAFQGFLSDVRTLRSAESRSDADIAAFEAKYGFSVTAEPVASLLLCSDGEFDAFAREVERIRSEVLTEGVTDEEAGEARAHEMVEESTLSGRLKTAAKTLLTEYISVNKKVDEALTAQEKERARESVSDVVYQKNQVIVRKGEILTDNQIAMLEDLGLLLSGISVNAKHTAGIILFTIFIFSFFLLFCEKYQADLLQKRDQAILFAVLYGGTLLLTFVLVKVTEVSNFILPILVGAALLTLFFDEKIALVSHVMLSLSLGIFLGNDWTLATGYLLAGLLLIFCFRNTRTQMRIAISALLSCLILAGIFVLFGLLEGAPGKDILYRIPAGLLNGLLVTVITVGILPILESVFDVLTPTKLNDLSNPDKRLLKRLLLEAPGTYHHSLTVANLAEEAAEKIGANSYLAKVGAYYHDIGKIKNPFLFKENQMYGNPHDDLSPKESASIILSHTAQGLSLAKQYRLPRAVQRIIAEHHGTTSVAYFYHKAVEAEGKDNVRMEDFTYEGPVPSSREAAIIMLADSCEAAVRSLDDKTPEGMEKMVRSIIKSRMESLQLSGCDLSLKDIETITASFLSTFQSYFHERIQYPEEKKE